MDRLERDWREMEGGGCMKSESEGKGKSKSKSKSKVLILHHLEPYWNDALNSHFNTSFTELAYNAISHIESEEYDEVIITNFELNRDQYYDIDNGVELLELSMRVVEYGYDGWERDSFRYNGVEGVDYCDRGNNSEVVMLEDWTKELKEKECEVFVGGCFDGECLEDLEVALDYLEIPYNRVEELIV